MFSQREALLVRLRTHQQMGLREQLSLVGALSLPAILAQLSTILMQYIDACMVGSLGASASASIGLVSTTIWLFGGLVTACSAGFYVQVAHHIGGQRFSECRDVLRQSLFSALLFSMGLAAVGVALSPFLPVLLGAPEELHSDATIYFLIFSLSLPFAQLNSLCGGMLRSSGNTVLPSVLNALMCLLDVVFNYFLIFPTHYVSLLGHTFLMPGAGWGVLGAVTGTALSFLTCSIVMCWCTTLHVPLLHLLQEKGRFLPTRHTLLSAWRIAAPLGTESIVKCAAQIATTIIVTPLGTVAIAANAFGIIIESVCYMPGYGLAEASTTLVGQSVGAGRWRLAQSFGRMTVTFGIVIMSLMAVLMYVFAPEVMQVMSPDDAVRSLTTEILRIEAYAEPWFAISIVVYGVFVGTGHTMLSSLANLGSIWFVRIPLSALLAVRYGLHGVWMAMAAELIVRGMLFSALFVRRFSQKETILS